MFNFSQKVEVTIHIKSHILIKTKRKCINSLHYLEFELKIEVFFTIISQMTLLFKNIK